MRSREPRFAYVISSHGFGHAARAAAIADAVHGLEPRAHFEIFTSVPAWFFEDSLAGPYAYRQFDTDVGIVQRGPMEEDLGATLERLDAFYPLRASIVASLAEAIRATGCDVVACDVAPLGIAAARAAGRPSILVENFTWDWIYEGYAEYEPGMARHAAYLRDVFASADHRVQTEPATARASADLVTAPVSRRFSEAPAVTRERLGVSADARLVLVTMGGIPERFAFVRRLAERHDVTFVLPGAADAPKRDGNLILLPHRSGFLHTDLLRASDAVVGKLGYSTVAEAFHAGVPFGYVQRPKFRESGPIAAFVEREMPCREIAEAGFYDGSWIERLDDLLALERVERDGENGAAQAARFLLSLVA